MGLFRTSLPVVLSCAVISAQAATSTAQRQRLNWSLYRARVCRLVLA